MFRSGFVAVLTCSVAVAAVLAERQWQTGTWREAKVDRPRVVFGVEPRDPSSSLPRTAAAREVRTYVIETAAERLELRQEATVDTPRIGVRVGEPVTFAVEKKIVYVRDEDGKSTSSAGSSRRSRLERAA
jgi:hypothetical protein